MSGLRRFRVTLTELKSRKNTQLALVAGAESPEKAPKISAAVETETLF